MKIYISLPITGYNEDERRRKCESARDILIRKYGPQTEITTPFDICDMLRKANPDRTYGEYLGADIQFIIDKADAVYFIENPVISKSKGVMTEYMASIIYEKKILNYK